MFVKPKSNFKAFVFGCTLPIEGRPILLFSQQKIFSNGAEIN